MVVHLLMQHKLLCWTTQQFVLFTTANNLPFPYFELSTKNIYKNAQMLLIFNWFNVISQQKKKGITLRLFIIILISRLDSK